MADGGEDAVPGITRKTTKGPLQGAGWNPRNIPGIDAQLQSLVARVHVIVTHAFLLARFIFLRLVEDGQRDLTPLVTTKFFYEVFLCLTTRRARVGVAHETAERRRLINEYMPAYMEASGFRLVDLRTADHIATYEAKSICTAYLNNVQEHFGEHVRGTVNSLLRVKQRKAELRDRLRHDGRTEAEIRQALEREIFEPARRIKLAMQRLEPIADPIADNLGPELAAVNQLVATLRACYPAGAPARFGKRSIYYDAKARPEKHVRAMIALAAFRERNHMRAFQPLPLRAGYIPGSMLIDTTIAAVHLLGWRRPRKLTQKLKKKVWRWLFCRKRRIFKEQHGCTFRGTFRTDGISICIIKQDADSRYGCKRKRKRPRSEVKYLDDMPREELNAKKFVLVDPGRRDLMYCMHEESTPDEPRLFRYTSNKLAKDSRRRELRRKRQQRKARDPRIAELEATLVGHRRCTAAGFLEYVRARRAAEPYLLHAYGHPKWRELRLEGYMAQQRADARLVHGLREAFPGGETLVYGNWSRPNQRFHEPMPGVGLVCKLRKAGFPVVHLDEHCTSTWCPDCEERVDVFRRVPNPRPYRRAAHAEVLCHGLLRCTNQTCQQACGGHDRLWNRDLLAVLNFRHILNGLRVEGERPERFRRPHN